MRFGVLGPLAVWTDAGDPVRVPEVKVRALLAALLVRAGRPVPVDRLVEDVWGSDPPGKPGAVLRSKVSQLRRALAAAEPGAGTLVVHRAPGYLVQVGTDVQRFHELLGQARLQEGPRERARLLAAALALWRGGAYADFADAPFTRPTITALTQLRIAAVADLAEARLSLGEHNIVVGELAELVEQHPLHERLRAAYLRALYGTGQAGAALASFADLRARLAAELGADPGPELAALHEAMLRHDPALRELASEPPPPDLARESSVPAAAAARGNLPAELSELIGRDGAVAEVGRLLDANRLVTLTGPGGVGKTRLALRVAAGLTSSFTAGVWLVELDVPADPAEVIATALDVRDGAGAGPAQRLADAVRHRRMLLVLDNCEQVVEPVAVLVRTLLRAAPELRILVTSREPLGVDGERLSVVPPLVGGAAVQLFAARAGSALDRADPVVVAAICERLDGLPLALELAATRVRALGVHELAARLDDRFHVLTAGRRTGPPRHRTLRAVIDWSWELLTPPERVLLHRLAVASGSCSLATAEAVCGGGPDGPAAADVLDLLARLVDRSLVVAMDRDGADGPRYRLLESVAAYARERLVESGELDRVQRAHLEHFTAFAERAQRHLVGPDQRRWLQRMDVDAGNLRAALAVAVGRGDGPAAVRLANATAWYRYLRGRWDAARRAFDMALGIDGPDRAEARVWRAGFALLARDAVDLPAAYEQCRRIPDPALRARAEWFLGFARIGFGDPPADEPLLAAFRGDGWGTAATLVLRAWNALSRSDLGVAAAAADEAAALFAALGDGWGRMQAADVLGEIAQVHGDYAGAERLHHEGLRIAEDLGLWPDVSYKVAQLGRIALLAGDHPRADALHERARRLAAEQSDRFSEHFAGIGLALSARRQGQLERADEHLDGRLEWYREIGWGPGVALVCAERGFIAELRGDAPAALELHRAGWVVAARTGDPRALALAMEGVAGAMALAGDATTAARLLGAAGAARERAGAPLPPAERGDLDRITTAARKALGEEEFAVEFERGGRAGAPAACPAG